jgi:hypothetical protein
VAQWTALPRWRRCTPKPANQLHHGDGKAMSFWARQKAKVADRGTQVQRPRPRPQEMGIWEKDRNWK